MCASDVLRTFPESMAADTPPDPTRHRRIKSVFLTALALPEAERDGFLSERCASDSAMRAEVEELLRLERGGGATLDAGAGLREALAELREEPLPERIGPYRPIRLLGRGGMGEVYLCEKEGEDGSRYAVKRINAQSLNAEGRARFKREAAILARLDHPGIARVLDTGEHGEGRDPEAVYPCGRSAHGAAGSGAATISTTRSTTSYGASASSCTSPAR